MKIYIIKDKLKGAVQAAERVVGKNASLAILNSIVIEAEGSMVSVKATNLEVGIEAHIQAKVDQSGSVAISGQVLGNFLSNLYKEDKVSLEVVDGNVVVSTKHGSTLLKCLPTDDFPSIPHVIDGFSVVLPVSDLVADLKSVVYAAAVSDIKPEIASVYVYYEKPNMYFVATDSFRLAEKKRVLTGAVTGEFLPLIIPFKNVTEIIRVFDGVEAEATIQANKNQLSIYTESLHFTSRLLDGVFPDYRQIMPKGDTTKVTVAKGELLNALKLASVFSDRLNQIDVRIVPADKLFEINSKNQDVGENTIALEAVCTGEEITMSFNAKYILDCFQSLPSDGFELTFNGPSRPMVISGVGNNTFSYLVMPVRR